MAWTKEQKEYARTWSKQLKLNGMEFRRGAKWSRLWLNLWNGVGILFGFAVILESVVSATSPDNTDLIIAGAVMAGVAEGCSIITTFYDFAKRDEEHRRASRKSDKVARAIDIEITKSEPREWAAFAKEVNWRFTQILRRAPSVPTSTYDELQLVAPADIDERLDEAMSRTQVPAWIQHQFNRLNSSVV